MPTRPMNRSPRVTINITPEVIETACQRDSSHCMIADAIQQQIPKAKFISVDLATIRFTDLQAGRRYIYLTPRVAQVALIAFDQGEPVEPFKVNLANAHIVATGTGRKGSVGLIPDSSCNGGMTRVGGKTPPVGPLVGGAKDTTRGGARREASGSGAGNRTGRRRTYGIKGLIR